MQNKGLTLIELLVAITIVAIMSTLGFMGIKGQIKKAKATRAISAVKEVSKALELYYTKHDAYPTDITDNDLEFQNGSVPDGVDYTGDSTGYCLSVKTADGYPLSVTNGGVVESYVKNVTLNCTGCNGQSMDKASDPANNTNFCLENAQ